MISYHVISYLINIRIAVLHSTPLLHTTVFVNHCANSPQCKNNDHVSNPLKRNRCCLHRYCIDYCIGYCIIIQPGCPVPPLPGCSTRTQRAGSSPSSCSGELLVTSEQKPNRASRQDRDRSPFYTAFDCGGFIPPRLLCER